MILILKSTQNRGLQQTVRERFGRGSLGADPRDLAAGEAFPLVGEKEDDGSGGGAIGTPVGVALLSVQSSSCSVRTGMIFSESSSAL